MQVNPNDSKQIEHLATQTVRSNARSVVRSLSHTQRVKLAELARKRFEAQCAFNAARIECENAVESMFLDTI